MAGRPVLRKLAADIAARGDPEHDPQGEEYLLDRIVGGETLRGIASDFDVSAGTLLAWLRIGGKPGPRWDRYQEARELSSFVKAEEGQEMLERLSEEDPDDLTAPRVTLASAIAAHKRWQAERYNRRDFGQQAQGPGLVLNIQELHLDALKSGGGPVALPAAPAAPPEVEEAEYEVLDEPQGIEALL